MIYLFNQSETLIDIIAEEELVSFTHTVELNQFEQAEFEIPVDYHPEIVKESQFFGFFSADGSFRFQRIIETVYEDNLIVSGIDKAESDLHSFIIEDKRPQGTADQALTVALEGTGYRVGDTRGLSAVRKNSFYYTSSREALVKIIEAYGVEFRVRYVFTENKVTHRYIDLFKQFGNKTGYQFEYGTNILSVTYEETADDVVTALIGRGKGEASTDENGEETGGYGRRIQFTDVVWSTDNGKPVNKPAGINYVSSESARELYGLYQDGVTKHRFGVYVNDKIEDPNELLQATWEELQRLSRPAMTFKANLLDMTKAVGTDIWVGDSVAVVRDQIGLAVEARVHKLVIDKLNDNRSSVELGDYQTLKAKDKASKRASIESITGLSANTQQEEFWTELNAEIERRSAEVDDQIRIFRLQIDNAKLAAEQKASELVDSLSSRIDNEISTAKADFEKEDSRLASEVAKAYSKAGAAENLATEARQAVTSAERLATKLSADAIAEAKRLDEVERERTQNIVDGVLSQAETKAQSVIDKAQKVLNGEIDAVKTSIEETKNTISLKADKTLVSDIEKKLTFDYSARFDVMANQIASKVDVTALDPVKEKITTNETAIRQATNKIVSEVSRVEAKIPASDANILINSGGVENIGGNLYAWRNSWGKNYVTDIDMYAGEQYTVAAKWWRDDQTTLNIGLRENANDNFQWLNLAYDSVYDAWVGTIELKKNLPKGSTVRFGTAEGNGVGSALWATMVPGSRPLTHWEPSNSEMQDSLNYAKTTAETTAEGLSQVSKKVEANEGKLTDAETKFKVLAGEVSSSVEKQVYDDFKSKLTSSGSLIRQTADNAVASFKQTNVDPLTNDMRQAKLDIQANAEGLRQTIRRTELNGYVSKNEFNTTLENSSSFTREISRVEGKIPKEYAGNLLKASNVGWYNKNQNGYELAEGLIAGKSYTLVSHFWGGTNTTGHTFNPGDGNWQRLAFDETVDSWVATFKPTKDIPAGTWITLASDPAGSLGNGSFATLVKGDIPLSVWQPHHSEITSQSAFSSFKQTVESFMSTIGDANSVSQRLQTASGLVDRVQLLENKKTLTNLIVDAAKMRTYKPFSGSASYISEVSTSNYGMLRITRSGLSANAWTGFMVPLSTQSFTYMEKLSISGYLWVDTVPDDGVTLAIKHNGATIAQWYFRPTKTGTQWVTRTATVSRNTFQTDDYGLHIMVNKNGQVAFEQLTLVRGEEPAPRFIEDGGSFSGAVQTQVSTLAGSWAVKNLNSSGEVLSQINANSSGIRIKGAKIQLDGDVVMDEAFVRNLTVDNANIGQAGVGKMIAKVLETTFSDTTYLRASEGFVNSLLAGDVLARRIEANRATLDILRSTIVTSEAFRGKIMEASNGAMNINLNNAAIEFSKNAGIRFHSQNNSIFRVRNGVTGYVNFRDNPRGGVSSTIGVTSHNVGIVNDGDVNYGKFAGVIINRDSDDYDLVNIIGDEVQIRHGDQGKAFIFKPNQIHNYHVDMNAIVNATKALVKCFEHISANDFNMALPNLKQSIRWEIDNYMKDALPDEKIGVKR